MTTYAYPFTKNSMGQHFVELCVYNNSSHFDDFINFIFYSGSTVKETGAMQGQECHEIKVWTDADGYIIWKTKQYGNVTIELEGYYPN